MLVLILLVLLITAVFGGYGTTRSWGYAGWSPLGVVLLILLVLWLTGSLRHL